MTKDKVVIHPIRRGLIISTLIFSVIIIGVIIFPSYWLFSSALYKEYNTSLQEDLTYVEHHIDPVDLKNCIDTGVKSTKYEELQIFLDEMVDDLGLAYLYIVIPTEDVMINVISASSRAELAEGIPHMELLEETDAYDSDFLKQYLKVWDADGFSFFNETSDYGTFYTGTRAVKLEDGTTIALICVDLNIDDVTKSITNLVTYSVIIIGVAIIFFGLFISIWSGINIVHPLKELENSANLFVNEKLKSADKVEYQIPEINTKNEVKSLSLAIEQMINELNQSNIDKKRLEQEASDANKISQLSSFVTTLMNNIPALAAYKDAQTGRYMACNLAFARYAGKEKPEDVIGLTDYDLFDEDTAQHFVLDDHVTLKSDQPYHLIESVPDASGKVYEFRTVKIRFNDPNGHLCVLSMSIDTTELKEALEDSRKAKEAYETAINDNLDYSNISRALSLDYSYIFYVDITNDDFIEYRSNMDSDELILTRRGKKFFKQAQIDAKMLLHKDDYMDFIRVIDKQNVLDTINRTGTFTTSYRQIDSGLHYMNLKASHMKSDPNHIFIGVSNVDAQMMVQEEVERVREERITYSRINALTGDFIVIYTVDPLTDHYIEYSATDDFIKLGIEKSGEHFFDDVRVNSEKVLYKEDIDKFNKFVTKNNIIKSIEKDGVFSFDYRLLINDEPIYVTLKATEVEEKNTKVLIFGVINIDSQVKREEEYNASLNEAREKADIDALTRVKNKHAYIDLEQELNHLIEEHEPIEFAVVVCDINGLKHVNDVYGHSAGDEYIKLGCQIICDVFKRSPVYRVGGDEFAVIVRDADYENIDELMDEIHEINEKNLTQNKVVIASGMAIFHSERNVSAVFEKADKKMYKDKHYFKEKEYSGEN